MNRTLGSILATLLLLGCATDLCAQYRTKKEITLEKQGEHRLLIAGEKIPDEFWTKQHLFFINGDTVRKDLSEFKNKLLVLDFWYIGCSHCLLHQKDIETWKKKYPDDIAVIMVNNLPQWDSLEKISKFYTDKTYEKYGMEGLTSIIYDDYLYELFAGFGYPLYVWIRPTGSIAALTNLNLFGENFIQGLFPKKK